MPLFAPLDDFRTADLPERTAGFWKLAGPGAVLVGLSIGAGEIIIWPTIVAEHGAGMVWAAVIGVFLQLWINFEVARWTLATGETVYTGFSRVWRGFGPTFILLTILGWLAPGWAQASGSALKALIGGPNLGVGTVWGSTTFWTCVTFGVVILLLFGPKMIYHSVEKSIEVLVLIVTLGLILVAVFVGTADTWAELGRGAINIGYRAPGFPAKELFMALVFAGAGGTANLFYSFYLRDKNVGMGSLIPDLESPLRGRAVSIPSTGFLYPDTPENARRFRSWWTYIRQDQALFFWLLNTFTLMLFIFGALAVLHKQGVVPSSNNSLIWDESVILGEVFGRWGEGWGRVGRTIFLMVGVATLFSTQLALVDGVSRSISDILHTNFHFARKRGISWWYMVIALGWIAVGIAITFVIEWWELSGQLGVLFNAAYMGGFAMAVYVPLMLYMNLRYLPKSARPQPLSIAMMSIASVIYVGFAGYCLWAEITSRIG